VRKQKNQNVFKTTAGYMRCKDKTCKVAFLATNTLCQLRAYDYCIF